MRARAIGQALAAWAAVAAMALTAPVSLKAQEQRKRAITFQDLISMHRLSEPQVSPDGKWIAYAVSTPDLEANKSVRNIWIVSASGGEPKQLTRGGTDARPRWSPDGKKLAFLSSRVENNPQVYWMNLQGGEANRVTSLSTGADNELWSPDGKTIAFVSAVYPDCQDDACNARRDTEKQKSKVKARIYEKLLYRHWTGWSDGKRSHLFVVSAGGGTPRDLTPGADYDVPPFNLGGPEPIAFSPDSKELCFTANTDKDEALSTNGDLFTVPVSGAGGLRRITTNPGNDWGPVYSPNGMWIAYRAQMQPGEESDRWRLMLYTRSSGKIATVTEDFDHSVESYEWSPSSETIYFTAEEKGEMTLWGVAPPPKNEVKGVLGGFNAEFDLSRDGHTFALMRTSLTMPAELFVASMPDLKPRQLTHQNGALLSQLDLSKPEMFWFEGAEKTQVEGLLIRPPHFDPSKKYPALLLIHGGPQGAWTDAWGYRWNEQVMAAPGYVVLAINPRGSTGYGQKFTAEISRDWGGKVYEDLMNGLDAATAKYSFIDGSRVGAAGGSYGGYMIDWIATHTGRFKCLISHAGPYDIVSMGATEELWFNEWEFGGTPWANPENYKKWSPSEFAAALGKYKTPTLVVGGELDFRVPYTQDLEFFTALQTQGVPSKLLIFPDEGHWVLKPQNSELWYKTFLAWLAEYLK
jgi:dipeptidyl aminopeptidase/acylaminoacyl peptidase